MIIRITIVVLCCVGLYASAFMTRKTQRAEHGKVKGPSVVKTRRARVIAGIPNSIFGLAYYGALAGATPFLQIPPVYWTALAAAAGAACMSAYLAYSLLFITRMECKYCWMSHVVNWSLLAILIAQHPR